MGLSNRFLLDQRQRSLPKSQVRVRKKDGAVSVQYFTHEDGAVMLDPDVKARFPDSESVNEALRSLMTHR